MLLKTDFMFASSESEVLIKIKTRFSRSLSTTILIICEILVSPAVWQLYLQLLLLEQNFEIEVPKCLATSQSDSDTNTDIYRL